MADREGVDKNVNHSLQQEFSDWSTYVFIVLLIIYFIYKYKSDCSLYIGSGSTLTNRSRMTGSMLTLLFLLFSVSVICQIVNNTTNFNKICTNNEANNAAISIQYCLLPWIFIFGVTIVLLLYRPEVKNVFSFTIGYLFVAKSLEKIFEQIHNPNAISVVATKGRIDQEVILSNNLTPELFEEQWAVLIPKLKKVIPPDSKHKIFELTVMKDNIGEFMWYLLSGLLASGYASYLVSSNGCEKSVQQLSVDFYK